MSKQGLGAHDTLPSMQNLSLFYCAMALGGFRLCKLQAAHTGGLVQPFAGFQSLVLLCCSVHVPGSVWINSVLVGSKADPSGLFPMLMNAYGIGFWSTAKLRCPMVLLGFF